MGRSRSKNLSYGEVLGEERRGFAFEIPFLGTSATTLTWAPLMYTTARHASFGQPRGVASGTGKFELDGDSAGMQRFTMAARGDKKKCTVS